MGGPASEKGRAARKYCASAWPQTTSRNSPATVHSAALVIGPDILTRLRPRALPLRWCRAALGAGLLASSLTLALGAAAAVSTLSAAAAYLRDHPRLPVD
jgi:hypothetical protein